jgi:hypothetical protein
MMGTFETLWSYLMMWRGKANRDAAANAMAERIIAILSGARKA